MKRNYVYLITIVLLSILVWCGYYLYLEVRPVSYENGTFVEVPKKFSEEQREMNA